VTKEEKTKLALRRGRFLLRKYGLEEDWKIIPKDMRKTVVGQTWYNKNTILLSKRFIRVCDKEQFDGVFLHEIAHVLTGFEGGHGNRFVKTCEKIGVPEEYTRPASPDMFTGLHVLYCPTCKMFGTTNDPESVFCQECAYDKKVSRCFITRNSFEVFPW